MRAALVFLLLGAICVSSAAAQGIRERIRAASRGTKVSAAQASDLTLTVTPVATRLVQVWLRSAGAIDSGGKTITAALNATDARFAQVGQRARAFPVESRSSMYQARVVRVDPAPAGARVGVELIAPGRPGARNYVVEIVAEPAQYLSVPNEAIIEEGDSRVVYVQVAEGEYQPRTIKTGLQGELYTQILDGVKEGEQVVTFGSFFIDADYKLKGTAQVPK
jgi:hypothetical protein